MNEDNSTPLSRMEQLCQYIDEVDAPDEVRVYLSELTSELIEGVRGMGARDPDFLQEMFGGRTVEAFDDLQDIIEQMLSAMNRLDRWTTAWVIPAE